MKKGKQELEQSWSHPGGKLVELGADKLSDAELLSILIGTGTKSKSAEQIATEIIRKFGGYKGMANQPLEKFLEFKGMGDVKIIRIAATFEIARRIANIVVENLEPDKKVITKNSNENVISWDGKLYRAITVGWMSQKQMDNWIEDNGDKIHKMQADRKVVFGFNKFEDYIVCSGKLYRAITEEIKDFDDITGWVTDNRDFLLELENSIEKNAEKNTK
jgi:hypothetical protein